MGWFYFGESWMRLLCGHSLKQQNSLVSDASCAVSCFHCIECVWLDVAALLGCIAVLLFVRVKILVYKI